MNIVTVFRRAADRYNDRIFAFDPGTEITYAEADERSDAVAVELQARGVAEGDCVGLSASDRVSLWLTIIGVWKTGALPSLIDPRTPAEVLPYFLGDIDAPVVAAAVELHDKLAAAGASSLVDIDALGEAGTKAGSADRHSADAPLFLSYTSGTTGKPKGAILLSEPVTLATACIAERLRLTSSDVLLATTPTASSFQLVAAAMPAMHRGATLGLVAGSSTETIWQQARQRQASVLVAYPLTLADMVHADDAVRDQSPFRVALSGGSPLAPRIKRDYADRLGIHLLESYGQSELGGFMAMGAEQDGERALAGYVGRPLPDRLTFVGDEQCRELAPGEPGEVLVTHGYFAEYRNKPEKTAETTHGGVLHTGDIGVADADGYLRVLGRTREAAGAAQRGGFLRELEDAYYEHEAVQHAAVVETEGGDIACFVELQTGRSSSAGELQEFALTKVTKGLTPRSTALLEKMPRSFSGKADRLALAQAADQ